MELQEAKWLKESREGSKDAFESLVSPYINKIYAICFRVLGHEQDAYDAAQETLLRAYRSIGTFKGNSAFSTWLYRIATNQALDTARKKGRHKVVSMQGLTDKDDSPRELEMPDASPGPSELLEQEDTVKLVQKAIGELKEEFRTVIVLRELEGLSYEEIAVVTGASVGTVKSRLNRGRQSLKKILEGRI